MALDFPTATTVGQVYTDPVSGNVYTVTVVGPPAQWVGSGSSTSLDNTYLRKDASNDPVTGTLTVTPATNVEGLVVTQPSGNTSAAMRITNEGTGNCLVVEDSANPDSTAFVIDSGGRLLKGGSGRTVPNPTSLSNTPPLQIEGTVIDEASQAIIYNNPNTSGGGITLGKSRGSTTGSSTAVASGDTVGFISFAGANGSTMSQCANIRGVVDGTVTGGGAADMPGRLEFWTSPDGSDTPVERMRITNAGDLLIGGTLPSSPNAQITTGGNVQINGAFYNVSNSATINNAASVSVTVPSRGAGFCYLVSVSRRQSTNDNFQGLYLVHYGADSTPQAVITVVALGSMTVSASGATITLTNGLGFLTAATIVATRIA